MTGDIDSTIPAGLMHLIERKSSLFHQHGGVATEVAFDSLEEMSLDDFIEKVVPTLKQKKNTFAILKDSTRDQLVRILADNVAIYHMTGIQDVFYDAMIEKLMSDQQITIMPNLQFPLILWRVEQSGEKVVCVEIPEAQFEMAHYKWRERFLIWHPRLWLKMRLTVQNVPCAFRLRAMPFHPQNLDNDRVYSVPFPNVYESGDICWGNTRFTRSKDDAALTVNDAILLTLNRFFGSTFNFDLLDRQDMMNMANLYKNLPLVDSFEKMLKRSDGDSSVQYMIHLFRCFQDKESLTKFKYHAQETAKKFLEARI